MSFKYNLNYISGINEYTKRAIYTLVIDKDYFYLKFKIKGRKMLECDYCILIFNGKLYVLDWL